MGTLSQVQAIQLLLALCILSNNYYHTTTTTNDSNVYMFNKGGVLCRSAN